MLSQYSPLNVTAQASGDPDVVAGAIAEFLGERTKETGFSVRSTDSFNLGQWTQGRKITATEGESGKSRTGLALLFCRTGGIQVKGHVHLPIGEEITAETNVPGARENFARDLVAALMQVNPEPACPA